MPSTALVHPKHSHSANPDLSAHTTPILSGILEQIEQLTRYRSESVRILARESRMVLTVRIASSAPTSRRGPLRGSSDIAETYQKALKQLQDPILPVRAHGLLLLRQLVTSTRISVPPPADLTPLVPAILDIFLQAIQDSDSYIFLNAVQGLAAVVNSFGKGVLRQLAGLYTRDADTVSQSTLTQQELDSRLRVGEALGQVIRQCGSALPDYGASHVSVPPTFSRTDLRRAVADLLVPSLFTVVRAQHLPTALRTSALSLLGQCADTNDLALLPYAADLTSAMIDLLQIERGINDKETGGAFRVESPSTMDGTSTTRNARFPPFRRAALHFLALLVRAYTRRLFNGDTTAYLRGFPTERLRTTLGYVGATDVDGVVRIMAREVGEAVEELERAVLNSGT
jgi:hypothetical protein